MTKRATNILTVLRIINGKNPEPHPDVGGQAPDEAVLDNEEAVVNLPQRRRRIRLPERVDETVLPDNVQQRMHGLKTAVAAKRPPVGQLFARRGAPRSRPRRRPRRRVERWSEEEDKLLQLMRENGFPYRQIE